MTDRRPVLCATDFSKASDRALEVAAALARSLDAPLAIVHAMDTGLGAETAVTPEIAEASRVLHARVEARVTAARAALDAAAARVGAPDAGREIVDGRPAESIAAHATAIDAWIVVLGTHGATHGLTHARDVLLGTTADRLVRDTARPVLVVPSTLPSTFALPAPWVAGVSIDPTAVHALEEGIALSLLTKTPINAVHVVRADEPDERPAAARFDELVVDALARAGIVGDRLTWVVRGDAGAMLAGFAKDLGAILVIGTHAPGALARLARGSTAARVIEHAEVPVLVVPKRKS